eukprot:TRINITY_DN43382_c0_g1_i1.p2 TRINITY_DN43382_c0_g1~~TRINITY_DN43382_c0_g1_i1.p2  ORF type:complete len:105 (+),score=18.89 TRINITY_DN43382_c0_g1_i1:7-321(+)
MYCCMCYKVTGATQIYTILFVGSVRCVQETVSTQSTWASTKPILQEKSKTIKKEADSQEYQKYGKWQQQEDDELFSLIETYGEKNWKIISQKIKGRSPIQCLHR